ncbi:MAG: DUF2459 domain-containing protein [Melioribacteraceae bacterium]|nr:DUF2459 domain-containing protein [Melioribacteraceae bacterium]MCF8420328.1 DUF2459 domain-containing protein [Melioribacteraceae bacterium]
MNVIYLFTLPLLLFINQEVYREVIIAKVSWHTGIILKVDEQLLNNLSAAEDFLDYKFIDIGWGDADFYQNEEDFDLLLAAKAILVPSNSVIRMRGYRDDLDYILSHREYAFSFDMRDEEFDSLYKFINDSFTLDSLNKPVIVSKKFGGIVKFYESIHKYHLGNTCNTWVADALTAAGKNVDSSWIITAEDLYYELIKTGKLIKTK